MPRQQPAVEAMARLVTSADFERILRSSSRATTPHFAVHHLSTRAGAAKPASAESSAPELSTALTLASAPSVDDSPKMHFGVVVPKRHARRAVTRSLLKRQIYAAGDQYGAALDAGMWVVRLRAPFDRAVFPSAASDALRLLARSELDTLFRAVARPAAP